MSLTFVRNISMIAANLSKILSIFIRLLRPSPKFSTSFCRLTSSSSYSWTCSSSYVGWKNEWWFIFKAVNNQCHIMLIRGQPVILLLLTTMQIMIIYIGQHTNYMIYNSLLDAFPTWPQGISNIMEMAMQGIHPKLVC